MKKASESLIELSNRAKKAGGVFVRSLKKGGKLFGDKTVARPSLRGGQSWKKTFRKILKKGVIMQALQIAFSTIGENLPMAIDMSQGATTLKTAKAAFCVLQCVALVGAGIILKKEWSRISPMEKFAWIMLGINFSTLRNARLARCYAESRHRLEMMRAGWN